MLLGDVSIRSVVNLFDMVKASSKFIVPNSSLFKPVTLTLAVEELPLRRLVEPMFMVILMVILPPLYIYVS